MKKIHILGIILFISISLTYGQIELVINGVTMETSGGVYTSGVSNVVENGTGYYKGTIESGPLSGATEFGGLTFSSGFTGTIKRITGSSYTKGNEEGTNFKRYYEINNTGSAGNVNLTVDAETSGTNDESNSLAGPYFLYTYNSAWKGRGFGSTGSVISANNVNLPAGATDLVISEGVGVKAKIFLQGPYNTSTDAMNTTINTDIPLTPPYSADARTATTKPATAVDWVLVELRDQTTPSTIVASRSAYLNSDGNLIDDNATSGRGIGIAAAPGNYYLVIKHRNHLGVMTSAVQNGLTWGTASTVSSHNFTNNLANSYTTGPSALALLESGVWGMISGDGNSDRAIDATDQNLVWRPADNQTWDYSTNGFADFNLDKSIDATDQNLFWRPNNGKSTQLP